MNIIPTGNAHSGIDDAKNLAQMVKRLHDMGGVFREVTTWIN